MVKVKLLESLVDESREGPFSFAEAWKDENKTSEDILEALEKFERTKESYRRTKYGTHNTKSTTKNTDGEGT